MELRTTSFIETTGIAFSDSVSHNQVQVLSIPVLLLASSQDCLNAYNRYAMCHDGHSITVIGVGSLSF